TAPTSPSATIVISRGAAGRCSSKCVTSPNKKGPTCAGPSSHHHSLQRNALSADLAVDDRRECSQAIQRGGASAERVAEFRVELTLLAVQRHVVQQNRLHQQIHVVGSRAAAVHHVAAGAVRTDLLVTGCART